MKELIIILSLSLINACINAQKLDNQMLSPSGIFDEVYDRFGNNYTLDEIRIDERIEKNKTDKTALLCSAGYFDLYFEANCGMEGNSTAEVNRRNVLCQLFNDLSQLIVPVNPTARVNIWVRDISTITANPSSIGVLGLASGYYTLPTNAPTYNGIIDNEIWKTINSGINSYTNVTSPLISPDSPNPAFYHGMIAFNFSNPSILWHSNLAQTTPTGLYDLYSVALHETTHALGFASLIDSNGDSKFGISNQYYSRYDLFLNTSSSIPLITNTGNCSMYNFGFNSVLNPIIMTPSPFDCSTQLQFSGSVNQAIYSPSIFAAESSLSHLEDLCHSPNSYPDNEYYTMSDANGTGSDYMKRYLKPEERNVLCDLGYQVDTIYGNTSNLNQFNYSGSVCLGLQVAGINDGIDTSGFFQHIVTVGNNITLSISDILQNDYNTASFECLEDIYGHGTPDTTSGTTFDYTATSPGLALLRYIPVSASGNRGNITYIFIYVQSGNCNATACNIVNNGGVENGVNCGKLNNTNNCSNPLIPDAYCWTTICGTPDYFVRECIDVICPSNGLTIPSTLTIPPIDTWNSSTVTNDKILGLVSINSEYFLPNTLNEAIQVSLKTPLQSNISYTLKFVARVVENSDVNYDDLPGVIEFAGSPNLLAPISYFFNTTPSALTSLSQIAVPNNNDWNSFEVSITNTSTSSLNYISIINAGYLNNNPVNTNNYILIDDLSIVATNELGVMNLPDSLCANNDIQDLSLHLSPAPAGGIFTGNGVTFNGTDYSFETAIAGSGNHVITYTYTNNIGCETIIYDTITLNPLPVVSLASFNIDTICNNSSVVILPTGTPTGGVYAGTGLNGGNFDPILAGIGSHTITYTYTDGNSCNNNDTTIVTVQLCTSIENISAATGIIIYPNPSTGQFTIEKPSDLNNEVLIKLLDSTSKLVLERIIPISKQKIKIDIRNYSTGIYYLHMIVDDEEFIKQILKK